MAKEQQVSRQETINGLRQLADYLQARPDVPMPYFGMVNAFGQASELSVVARAMGEFAKDHNGEFLALVKSFGPVSLHVNFSSSEVCERVVVGTEEVPAKPAHTREIVEWKCPESLLALGAEA
jgi:hypothetical protein